MLLSPQPFCKLKLSIATIRSLMGAWVYAERSASFRGQWHASSIPMGPQPRSEQGGPSCQWPASPYLHCLLSFYDGSCRPWRAWLWALSRPPTFCSHACAYPFPTTRGCPVRSQNRPLCGAFTQKWPTTSRSRSGSAQKWKHRLGSVFRTLSSALSQMRGVNINLPLPAVHVPVAGQAANPTRLTRSLGTLTTPVLLQIKQQRTLSSAFSHFYETTSDQY